MPDSPDYNKYLPNSTRFSLQDMGELAARLGSFSVFDRRGEIVWYDRCAFGTTPWIVTSDGAGAEVVPSVYNSYLSPYSLKMTSGNTLGASVSVSRRCNLFDISSIGFEVATLNYAQVIDYIVKIEYVVQSIKYSAQIKVKYDDNEVFYYDESGNFVSLADPSSAANNVLRFVNLKMVVDLITHTYRRVIYDVNHYENLIYPINPTPLAVGDYFEVTLQVHGESLNEAILYLGQAIITSNEP
jgi:hypothetical protein